MSDSAIRSNTSTLMLTVLRLVVGVIWTVHGWMKLSDFAEWKSHVASMGLPAPEIMAPLAVAGELLGGLGLLVGSLTPLAALGAAATMLTAILAVHLPHGLLAKNNGFEYPLTLLAVALFFMFRGAGPISVDALISRTRRRRRERAEERRALDEQHGHAGA